jgi:hypothetical protein
MKAYNLSETGSALIVEVIILALVLAAAGYFAYKNMAGKTTPGASISPKPHTVAHTMSPSPSTSPATNLFSVSQFGVHFNYSGDPSGLKYTYQTKDFVDVLFDSTKLDQMAGCTGSSGAIGFLSRDTTDLGKPAADANTDGQVAHVGGYYYFYTHPQNPCSPDPAGQQEETREESVLVQDLKTLSAN